MNLDILRIKRKHRKKIFDYLISRYGIEKATHLLNDFFEKNWQEIPGQDILQILNLVNENEQSAENRELVERINNVIENMQRTIHDLKIIKKIL